MATHKESDSDLLGKYSHLSLYFALALLLAMGTYAVLIHVFPDSSAAAMAHRLAVMLPIGIILALAALRSSLRGVSAHPHREATKVLLHDEVRVRALNRAYRNGLITVVLAQPVLVLLLTAAELPFPLVPMASATVLLGAAAVLCSLIAYDS
jgi:hypothetical protein